MFSILKYLRLPLAAALAVAVLGGCVGFSVRCVQDRPDPIDVTVFLNLILIFPRQ
jgi:hypothetical protein